MEKKKWFEVVGIWESTQVVFDSFVMIKVIMEISIQKNVIFMYRFLVETEKSTKGR